MTFDKIMKNIHTATSIVECDEIRLLLQSHGIECDIQNEQCATSASYGLPTQPLMAPEVWVEDEEYEQASQLVAEFIGRDHTLTEEYGPEPKGTRFVAGIMWGLVIAAVLFSLWFIPAKWHTGIQISDQTGNGKPDAWYHYQRGTLTRTEEDMNGDGRVDAWWFYKDGSINHAKIDADHNGIPDMTMYYKKGRLTKAEWRPNGSEILIKKEIYRDGAIKEEWIDENGDGNFDTLISYDWMGNIASTKKL